MANWLNGDELYVKFGTSQATAGNAGAFAEGVAGEQVLEIKIPALSALGAVSAPTILSDVITFPKNAKVKRIEIRCDVAVTSAGSGAKLNLGLQDRDRSTEIDYDGYLDSVAQADFDVINEVKTVTVVASGAGGTLMDDVSSSTTPSYVVAYYETEAFTAGAVTIKMYFIQSS